MKYSNLKVQKMRKYVKQHFVPSSFNKIDIRQ